MRRTNTIPFRRATLMLSGMVSCCAFAAWVYYTRPFTLLPWEARGNLSFLVYAKPAAEEQAELLTLGFTDVTLIRTDGETLPLRAAPRAALRTPPYFEPVVERDVPAGSYAGIRFSMRSPEIRNAWQGDTAPEGVALLHDIIELPVPFTVHPDATTILLAGFETETALHHHNGERVYLPVITLEVREKGDITHTTDDGTQISGGVLTLSTLYGMQWDGTMRRNVRASQDPNTTVDAETVEQLLPVEESGTLEIATSSTATESETNSASTTPAQNDSTTTSMYASSTDTHASSDDAGVIHQPSP